MGAQLLRSRLAVRAVNLLHVYIATVITGGAIVVVAAALGSSSGIGESYAEFWILAGLVALGEFLPVKMSDGHGEITTSTIFTFALLLRFGIGPAVLAQAIASTLADLATKKRAWKVAFNVSQYALALAGSGAVLALVAGSGAFDPLPALDRTSSLAILSAGATFFIINSWLPRIGMALQQRVSIWKAVVEDFVYQVSLNGVLLTLSPIVVLVGEKDLIYALCSPSPWPSSTRVRRFTQSATTRPSWHCTIRSRGSPIEPFSTTA